MRTLSLLMLLAAAACAPSDPGPFASGPGAPPPAAPAPGPSDQCGAARYQSFVGRSRFELPPPAPGETRRVACTTCPVTMDYSERRLNVFYDARTDVIAQIRCG